MEQEALSQEAEALLALCHDLQWRVVTAESVTGGLMVATMTSVAGCSHLVDRGLVAYSTEAKVDLLGVPMGLIEAHGAVSPQVAAAMAAGALARSRATVALSCTGVAGPDRQEDKPVGLVYVACVREGAAPVVHRHMFSGDRDAIRVATVRGAFRLLREAADRAAAAPSPSPF